MFVSLEEGEDLSILAVCETCHLYITIYDDMLTINGKETYHIDCCLVAIEGGGLSKDD